MSKYPRLNNRRKYKQAQLQNKCECCDEWATGTVCVEFTYMRGEDETYKVCDEHYQLAGTDLAAMIHDAELKWLKSKEEADGAA